MTSSDAELLAEFAVRKSDAAFAEIVRRYTNLVYAAARRQVRDPHMAQDVTQAAFLVLAQRAGAAPPKYLAGWLLTTTRYCARDAIKKQTRRTHHEREAAMARLQVTGQAEIPDPRVAEFLDDAMARLGARNCAAVGMRYLQDKPVNEVAAAIGVSPSAAQKILTRSLAKLRKVLRSRGVVLPSTAVLTAALLHESAASAPASLVVSSSCATASSVSFAKGAVQMMLWTKIKLGAAVAAATTMLAGTGSFLVIEALAQKPAPPAPVQAAAVVKADVAPVPASVAPFDSPFLELVGCRIKEPVSLKLSADPTPPTKVAWAEQQYPQVAWTIDPTLAAKVNGYAISITPTNDPAGTTSVQADKSAVVQALPEQLKLPGEYDVKVTGLDADSQNVASAGVHVIVNPLTYTQIVIDDIRPNGAIQFVDVMQQLNETGSALKEYRFINSDFVLVQRMRDDQGNQLRFTSTHQGDHFQYRCVFNKPVEAGDVVMGSNSGSMTGLIRKLDNGQFLYTFSQSPGSPGPTRRIELYRLPEGATLTYSSANLVSRVVDGRTQIFLKTVIPPGGSDSVSFRYRLPAN